MTERQAFFVFFAGFILTLFGVGGVEQSITDDTLLTGVGISVLGCLIMYCGVLGIHNAGLYSKDELYPWQK